MCLECFDDLERGQRGPSVGGDERRNLAGGELVHELVHAFNVRRDGKADGGA